MTMPPAAETPRTAARTSARWRSWPATTACATSRWGPRRTTRGGRGGGDDRPRRLGPVPPERAGRVASPVREGELALRGEPADRLWPSGTSCTAPPSTSASPRSDTRRRLPRRAARAGPRRRRTSPRPSSRSATASARTCAACRRAAGATRSTTSSATPRRTAARTSCAPCARATAAANGRGDVRVHFVVPESFNDAQDVGEQVQGLDPGDPQPPGRRPRAVQAPHRLRLRPHLRARRRHAADRREDLPAHAAQRRGVAPRRRRA